MKLYRCNTKTNEGGDVETLPCTYLIKGSHAGLGCHLSLRLIENWVEEEEEEEEVSFHLS